MKRILVAFLVLSLLPFLLFAQEPSKRFTEYGEFLIAHLSSAPFPHPFRAAGHTYQKQLYPADKHYSDSSVALFIPRGFRQTEAIDLVVYLHGWRNNIDTTLSKYKLPQQLYESGKNAILVVPEGPRNAPDSYAGKLEDTGGLKRFVADVVDFLFQESKIKTRSIGKIILSGHSGGGEGIAFALMRGGIPEKVREVYLFDALYGDAEKFTYWIDRFNGKLINIYTDSGGTKWDTEALMEDLAGWGIPYRSQEERAAAPSDLHDNRLVFIHTDLEHDMVVSARMQLREYLKASGLSNR
ncbi:MAG: hypothetical protein NTZ35_18760 [Ignavibacteriales bacterium]|nr:hypothetical protein [Ignavibacteriales bacterium]